MNDSTESIRVNGGLLRLLPTRVFVVLLATGLFLRVLVLPATGFQTDITQWQNWAQKIRHLGIERVYEPVSFLNDNRTPLLLVDHPPLNLYYLTFVAHLPLNTPYLHPLFNILIKFPGILFDCFVLMLLVAIARQLRYVEPVVRFIALLYWLNPGFIYHHSFWGLNESVSATIFLSVVLLLVRGNRKTALILLLGSLALKFQMIIFLPLTAVFMLFRPTTPGTVDLLMSRSVIQNTQSRVRESWFMTARLFRFMWSNVRELFFATLLGGLLLVYLYVPFIFGGTTHRALGVFSESVGRYPHLTKGAYNAWFAIDGLTGFSIPDTISLAGSISPRLIGILLFGVATLVNMLLLVRALYHRSWVTHQSIGAVSGKQREIKTEERGRLHELLIFSFALQGYSFFMLPTEMHERYIFYAVTFLPLFAWKSKYWYALYGVTSFTYLANIVLVYNHFHAHWPQATAAHYIISILNILCYGYVWKLYVRQSKSQKVESL